MEIFTVKRTAVGDWEMLKALFHRVGQSILMELKNTHAKMRYKITLTSEII